MRFAIGKHAKFISDRSGFAYPYRKRVKEWNGSIVHSSELEPKHPQLTPSRPPSEPEALFQTRPDRVENEIERLLLSNPFSSGAFNSATITVTERSHGRSTDDVVRFRNVNAFDGFSISVLQQALGYSITKVDDNSYTFSANGETATLGNKKGAGTIVTAGPITVAG
tara:strand:- start:179 stop:679 length:501 start_codon:yes stop_codon:yes gene_type:complete